MTTNGGDIKFSFTGDSSDLNASLDKASKHLVDFGSQGTKTAGKLSKDLSKASVDSRRRVHELSETAGDADSVMMGLAGAIDLVSPAMGGMVRVSGDLLAATESVFRAIKFSNPVFLALAVAAGVLGTAYAFLAGDDEAAEEAAKKHREEREKLQKLFQTHAQAVMDLTGKNALLRGETSKYAQALHEAEFGVTTVSARLAEQLSLQDDSEESLRVLTQSQVKSGDSLIMSILKTKYAHLTNADAVAAERKVLDELRVSTKALGEKQAAEVALRIENVKLTEADRIAKEGLAKSTRGVTTATEEYIDIFSDDDPFGGDGMDIDFLIRRDQLFFDARMEREEKIQAAIMKRAELEEEAAARAAAAAQASQEKQLTMAGQFAGSYFGIISNMNDRLTADDEESAMRSFRINQAAALVQIAVNTALAVSKASAQTGVLAVASIPGIVALGAAQAAVVASQAPPTFHTGGMIAPDERTITAQTGEGVLSRSGVAAAGGAEGVHALNSGKGGQTIIVQQVWKHKIFDEFITENLRRTGSPLASAIRKGALV